MSKQMADIISNYVTPLYGENTEATMNEYSLESGDLYHQFGSAIKVKSKDRYFLLTAKHCTNHLDGKYPSAFFTLVKGLDFSETIMPIMAKYTDIDRNEEHDESDIAFYEIDTTDEFWIIHKEKVSNFFFNLDAKYTLEIIQRIIEISESKGFIYGFPEKNGVDHEKCAITPTEQLIPVSNISANEANILKLDYDLDVPCDFDDNKLFGMSGGGLFCKYNDHSGNPHIVLIGMHIRGEYGKGQSIISPFFSKPTDIK